MEADSRLVVTKGEGQTGICLFRGAERSFGGSVALAAAELWDTSRLLPWLQQTPWSPVELHTAGEESCIGSRDRVPEQE